MRWAFRPMASSCPSYRKETSGCGTSRRTNLAQATTSAAPAVGDVPHNVCCGPGYSRPDVEFSSYRWAPDSRHVALHLDDRRRIRKELIPDYLGEETGAPAVRRDFPGDNDHVRDIAIYSVATGMVRVVGLPESVDRSIANYDWSADGRRLLIDQYPQSAVHRWIFVTTPEDGSLKEVWHDSRETRTTQLWNSTWNSDGTEILFISDKDGRHRLYGVSITGGAVRQLTDGEWSMVGESGSASLTVSSADRHVYFVSNKKNPYERHVYRMPEKGGDITQITSLPGTHHPFLSPNASKLALLHSNDLTPTELYIVDSGGRRRTAGHPFSSEGFQSLQMDSASLRDVQESPGWRDAPRSAARAAEPGSIEEVSGHSRPRVSKLGSEQMGGP